MQPIVAAQPRLRASCRTEAAVVVGFGSDGMAGAPSVVDLIRVHLRSSAAEKPCLMVGEGAGGWWRGSPAGGRSDKSRFDGMERENRRCGCGAEAGAGGRWRQSSARGRSDKSRFDVMERENRRCACGAEAGTDGRWRQSPAGWRSDKSRFDVMERENRR